jgi:hypothetical protein
VTDTLYVGQAILDWMRDTARPAETMPWQPPAALYGLPVVLDGTLPPGAWQLRDGLTVITAGGIDDQPGRTLAYVRGVGFLSIADVPMPPVEAMTLGRRPHIDPLTEQRWIGLNLPDSNYLSWLKITEMGTGA